jgi:hypothetical protein
VYLNFPGNEMYRSWIRKSASAYARSNRGEKARIVNGVVQMVRGQTPPGRFLSQDVSTGYGAN